MDNTCSPSPAQDQADASDIPKIIMEVARKHRVTPDDITSHQSSKHLWPARHEAYARARYETGCSLPELGRAFNRDHTSIMHGIARFENPTNEPKPRKTKRSTMTPLRIKKAVEMRTEGKSWEQIAEKFGCSTTTVHTHCYKAAKSNPYYHNALEKSKWLAHQAAVQKHVYEIAVQKKSHRPDPALHIIAPDPETRDNELTGTPPLCRSALKNIETDGRGNIAKPEPTRISFGAISVPSVSINSGHRA